MDFKGQVLANPLKVHPDMEAFFTPYGDPMSASLNKVMIIGNLGADPELRYTSNNQPVTTLSVATHEVWGGKDGGEKQERTEWHRVVVFGRTAENCANYLKKGSPLYLEGRIQTRQWDDDQGHKRYTTEIVANMVQFLSASSPQDSASTPKRQGHTYSEPFDEADIPF